MVASFLQKCFGCKSSVDDTNECNTESIGAPVLEYSPSNPRAQDEELLSLLREPLLALEGSWFTRMRRLLDVLEERGGLRATLVGIVRGDLQPQTACYVLLESSNARTDDVVDQGYSFPFVNREAALVILQACVSKMAVPATTSRLAACVPLLHGGVAMGALWLTLETSQRKSLVMPAPAAPAAVRSSALGSGASGASMWPFYSGPAVSTTAAAALLANGTSLDTLAFTISMAVQGGDPDQLPWLTAAVHRLCAAGTMHTLAADLCDLLAAHVLRKFVLDTAVRAVLVPGDGSNGCPGTTTGPPDGNGSTAASVGYLLGASAGPNAAMGSPLQQSAASSRGLTRAQYSSMNGNPCSLNDASQLEPSPSVGVTVEAAVGPLGPAAEGQLQQHLPGLPRTASIGISTGLRASGLGPRAEPKPRRLSLLAAGSHSGGLPRDVIRASALNSGTQQPQDQQQAESTQHDQQQRTKPPPQQQLQQAALRQSPSLQQLMFQQQGQALGLGGFSHGQGRPPASWLLRRPHSVKSVMAAEPLPGLTAAAAAAVGGAPAAIAVDLILSRRTLSGTTTTRPLVVALPLGADPTAAAGPASAFLKTTDTRASKSANAANTCTNINSFLATAGCNSTSALMNSWQGGILPPPSTTVTAHTFPLQHTLLQVCSNAAASGNGSIGSGGDINNPAVVEDCCSLLQDVHRPCRDVCLLMGILSQQQELQKLQNLSPALAPPAVPTPLQRACVQLQEHLNATGAAAAASWRAVGIGGVCASPTGTPSPVRNGTGNNLASGPNGGSGAIFRGGGGLGAGLRSLVVVLVPSYKLTASSRGAAVDGAGAVVKNAPSSSGYMGLYVCFQARLPRSLLEAVRSSCQELVDEVLCRVVASRMCGDLAPELEVIKGATPGSYAVLRGLELNDEGNGPMVASQPAATASDRPASSGGVRATSSRRRGLSSTLSGVGVHAVSLFSRPLAQAPLGGSHLAGGSVPGPSPGGQGQGSVPSRVSARQLSGIISGMLLNTDELEVPAVPGPGQQRPQQPPPSPPGRSIFPQVLIKSFLSMRGVNNDDGGRGGDTTGTRGSANQRVSFSVERVLRTFNGELRAQTAPRVPTRGLQASAGVTGGSVIENEYPSAAVITAGEIAGGCPPDQLLNTATTNVEDLLGSLIDSMTGIVPTNIANHSNNNGKAADSGAGARSGGVGLRWQCNSILHVTAEDAREMARQQMDVLVSSITATAADTAAAARTAFLGDLAHLQLLDVLGRGGGGVVLRGRCGATDVAVKLMEMPIPLDLQPPSQHAAGVGEDNAERDRLMLRNRRAMLRHAMELWCGNMLSHPNIVQVYTTFNSVVLKLRKHPDGSRQFYLQPVPELRHSRPLQPQQQPQQQQGATTAAVSGELSVPTNGATLPASPASPAPPAPPADGHGGHGGKDNEPLEPNDSICTAILVEWCDKGSLATALCARTFPRIVPRQYDDVFKAMPYDMRDVYLTLLDVALALRHLHAMHLVHRDLKAANLLLKSNPLDPRGFTVKLADFGFVLQLNEVDADGNRYVIVDQPAGTVTHMPPEALSKDPRIDASADVYGFGIIMWEILAGGLRPYSQLPLDRIPRVVVKGSRPNFPDNVPASYRRLACACWSMQPCKRPPAAELVNIITSELAALESGG